LPAGASAWRTWQDWLLPVLALLLSVAPALSWAGVLPGELPAVVGQLTSLQGDVRWYDRDSAGWLGTPQQPLRNWPVAEGDRLRTGADGRAELRVGNTTLRLGADVDLTLQRLDAQGLVLWLQSGTLAIRLADAGVSDATATALVTREGRWLPRRPGHYRFDRQPDATQASVWRGELRFEGPDSALTIAAGQRADLWRDAAGGPTRYAWASVERDGFADGVARDERMDDAPATAARVPPGMSGWQDLDRHGDWLDSPEYGEVWLPRVVASGWAPYQDGRWAWVAPWGWTWIDAAPWGFAPFHYGSWVLWQGRWCWSPGPRTHHARYAPALSAWVGAPTVSVGIGVHLGGRPPPPRVVVPLLPPRFAPPQRTLPPPGVRHEPARPPEGWRRDGPGIDAGVPLRPEPGGRDREPGREHRDEARPPAPAPAGAPIAPLPSVPTGPPVPHAGPAPGAAPGAAVVQAPAQVNGPAAAPLRGPEPGPGAATPRPDRIGPRPAQPSVAAAPALRQAGPPATATPAPAIKPAEPAARPPDRPESRDGRDERRPAEPQRGDASQRPDRGERGVAR
jgi:hypothetical protein